MLKHAPKTWKKLPFWKHRYPAVLEKLRERIEQGAVIFPRPQNVFKALQLTEFEKVKVVILGQDPYHLKGYAHGLSFSTLPHVRPLPSSLRNIFKEYSSDLGYPAPKTGDLRLWAERGVLLLNTCLTVEEGKANSHVDFGWDMLTFDILRALDQNDGVVFNLWGRQARSFKGCIERSPVVEAVHPSGLSAHNGWFGSRVFSRTNRYLLEQGREPIDWRLI